MKNFNYFAFIAFFYSEIFRQIKLGADIDQANIMIR